MPRPLAVDDDVGRGRYHLLSDEGHRLVRHLLAVLPPEVELQQAVGQKHGHDLVEHEADPDLHLGHALNGVDLEDLGRSQGGRIPSSTCDGGTQPGRRCNFQERKCRVSCSLH